MEWQNFELEMSKKEAKNLQVTGNRCDLSDLISSISYAAEDTQFIADGWGINSCGMSTVCENIQKGSISIFTQYLSYHLKMTVKWIKMSVICIKIEGKMRQNQGKIG